MKFVKILSVGLLAAMACACSNPPPKPKPVIVKKSMPSTSSEQTVVYQCAQGKILTVDYAFEGKTPISATVYLGKQRIAREMVLDGNETALVGFRLNDFTWRLGREFSPEIATSTEGVALTNGDRILATNCAATSLKAAK